MINSKLFVFGICLLVSTLAAPLSTQAGRGGGGGRAAEVAALRSGGMSRGGFSGGMSRGGFSRGGMGPGGARWNGANNRSGNWNGAHNNWHGGNGIAITGTATIGTAGIIITAMM